MALTVRCADFNADCPAQFTTADEGELMQHVEVHAKAAHPGMELTPELAEVVKTRVQQT